MLLVARVRVPVAAALIAAHAARIGSVIVDNVRNVPEWDFRVFWFHAQLAARGYDFYDRALVRSFLQSMHASPRFVELGRFWNPPQAMVLLLPLGWIDDLHVAYAVWYAVQIAALAGCVVLLWREFAAPIVAVAALLIAMYPTLATFVVGQTHFLVLLLVLAAWRQRQSWPGGVWLALAAVLKPIVLVVLLEPLLRKRWRMLAGFGAAIVALTVASIALFGLDVNLRFALHGAGGVPRAMLTQPPNRSALAAVLRAGWPEAVFVAVAVAVAVVLLLVVRRSQTMALAALLAAALLLYPQTLDHYGVMLIVAIVALWRHSTVGAVAACFVHALTAPVPGLFEFPNVVLASAIALVACLVTIARARVAIITAA